MQQEIYSLKRAIFELEKSVSNNTDVEKNIDIVIDICSNMKKSLNQFQSSVVKIDLKKINSIPFIYKPLTRRDYLSGNYLEMFSEERANELKEASVIDIHNDFWIQHQTIKGNIFGSMPKELLQDKSIMVLEKNRWNTALVNIYEPENKDLNRKELIDFCEENFDFYILIKEKTTNSFLILQYCI